MNCRKIYLHKFYFSERFHVVNNRWRLKYYLIANLLSVPWLNCLHALDFLLKLEDSVEKSFSSRGTSGNVNIDGDDSVASANDRVRIMIITAAVGARSHWDHPFWLGHLIIDFSQSWSHFIGQCAGNDDNIGLTGRSSEYDAITIHVVPRSSNVHHFYGTTSKTKSQWPNRAFATPIQDIVETGHSPLAPTRLFPKIFTSILISFKIVKTLPAECGCRKSVWLFFLSQCHCLLITLLLIIDSWNSDCFQKMRIISAQKWARRNNCVSHHLYCWIVCNDMQALGYNISWLRETINFIYFLKIH